MKKNNKIKKITKTEKRFKRLFSKKYILGLVVLMLVASGVTVYAAWTDNGAGVDWTGNKIGIGTDIPLSKLHIVDYSPLRLTRDVSGTEYGVNTAIDAKRFIFRGVGPNAANEILTMRHDLGWIGIGTISPLSKLHIVDQIPLRLTRNVNGTEYGIVTELDTARFILHGVGPNSVNSIMTIRHDTGNVGIGTIDPSAKLEVNGNIKAANYACSSDRRYKKGILPLHDSLQKILSLQGVSYFWKKDQFKNKNFDSKKDIGFVAQDMEKIFPELVYTGEDGYKSVNYQKMTAVLVEAVKELNSNYSKKISALEEENDSLKQKVASLEKMSARIAALEKRLDRVGMVSVK